MKTKEQAKQRIVEVIKDEIGSLSTYDMLTLASTLLDSVIQVIKFREAELTKKKLEKNG